LFIGNEKKDGNTMKNIKNIIFDLGRVITDIDFSKTIIAFGLLSNKSTEQILKMHQQTMLFKDMEEGKYTAPEFRKALNMHLNTKATDKELNDAWNAIIGETPWHRLEIINSLRPKYNTFLLSNTNEIHIDFVNNFLKKEYSIENLNPFFDKVYYSHKIGFRKPKLAAYQYVLDDNKIKAEESVFIDDLQQNLDAANQLNINTILKKDDESLEDLLKKFL
jgi:FMN phosphatase YigB (HAD superfamily)